MSAFVCSEEHFATMFNYIRNNESHFRYGFKSDENALLDFINTLIKANHYAVNCRYSERSRGYKFVPGECEKFGNINKFQFYKNIQCLSYQMSEGDTDKKFKKVIAKLRMVECDVANEIINSLPEYDAATWGP